MATPPPQYTRQDSAQTLEEGVAEYRAGNPGLLDPATLPPEVAELFRQHDAGHVVFGCEPSLRGEALIEPWTVVGTTAGLRGYARYFGHPEVNQIFAETGYWRTAVGSVAALPAMFRVLVRSRRLLSRWPWEDFRSHLRRPLAEIRHAFNIELV
jgi:hypothetical protein